MNRINELFKYGGRDVLSVYFTAGFPQIDSVRDILKYLQDAGADMAEIGIPFSDPLADGPVIQRSGSAALANGMSVKRLFEQLKGIRNEITMPLLLMGYLNPVMKFGVEEFCRRCSEAGIDGVILPDLPPGTYQEKYSEIFDKYGILKIFLITPETSPERIRYIDSISRGFIYMVSSSSTTGERKSYGVEQTGYFKRVSEMALNNPLLTGFGISSHDDFRMACRYSHGAITGSSFIKAITEAGLNSHTVKTFVKRIKGN